MSPLKILFVEPPAARRIGGIDTALDGWSRALEAAGSRVVRHDQSKPAPDISKHDVVHFHGLWETAHHVLRTLCRRAGVPYIVSPHGMLEPWAMAHKGWKKGLYFRFREQPGLRGAACLLSTSDDEARNLRERFPDSPAISSIPLGIDPSPPPAYGKARAALGWADDERICVFLSRLHAKKGLHTLVDAWTAVRQTAGPSVRLVIVGEGAPDYVEPLKRLTADDRSVSWTGALWGPEKWAYLQGADVFCLPTFSENFGFAVLEALAVGTPVITTPGTPWGSLKGNLPVDICDPAGPPLAGVLVDRLKAPPVSAAARQEAHDDVHRRFAWSALASRYIELYQSVLTSR